MNHGNVTKICSVLRISVRKTGCFGQKSLISCASKVVMVWKEVKSPHCMEF